MAKPKSVPPTASPVSASAAVLLVLSLILLFFAGHEHTSIRAVIFNPRVIVSVYNATTYAASDTTVTSMPPPPSAKNKSASVTIGDAEESSEGVASSTPPPPVKNKNLINASAQSCGGAAFSLPLQPAKNNNLTNAGAENSPSVASSMPPPPKAKNKNLTNAGAESSSGGAAFSVPPAKNKKPSNASAKNTGGVTSRCDLFDGKWVVDEPTMPSYAPGSCPFVEDAFNCYSNGRRDLNYTRLRWQPKGCNMPRFNGKKMLKMLRGKRVAFVGDSLNRNMWESMVCMLRQSLKDKSRVFEASGRKEFKSDNAYTFKFTGCNCSIEFYRSTFLVQPSQRRDSKGRARETLRLDLIDNSTKSYIDADVMVFNTGHWWTHEKTSKGINYYQEGDYLHPKLGADDAYRKALTTWARWIDDNIDPNRTRIFFRGYSWTHFSGGQWNSGGNCDGETLPITDDKHLSNYYPALNNILESMLGKMKTSVLYLNVTRMTDYRKDGHPSIYYLPPTHQKKPGTFQDCSHWCLPGVPDAWNQILYAMLLQNFRR